MVSRTALHRPAAILATAALALGAAGCGGSDGDGGGGGSDSYASTWNDVCQSLTTAQTTLQSEGAAAQKKAGSSPSEIQKALAEPAGRFIDSLIAALDRVKDLDAPSEFASFQDKVKETAPATISAFEKVKDPIASGDAKALQSALQGIDPSKAFPAPPASLKKQATACNAF